MANANTKKRLGKKRRSVGPLRCDRPLFGEGSKSGRARTHIHVPGCFGPNPAKGSKVDSAALRRQSGKQPMRRPSKPKSESSEKE